MSFLTSSADGLKYLCSQVRKKINKVQKSHKANEVKKLKYLFEVLNETLESYLLPSLPASGDTPLW